MVSFFFYFVSFTFSLLWQIPVGRDHIHHEVELGVVIGKTGLNIPQAQAMDYVGGYALALDMTDLDLIFKRVRKLSYYLRMLVAVCICFFQ